MEIEGDIVTKNSPKKGMLKNMSIALAENDVAYFTEQLSNNATWEIIGNRTIKGIDDIQKALHALHDGKTTVLHIDYIITHGNVGSTNGHYVQNGKKIAFSNVFQFGTFRKQAKIKKITSYFIYI